MSNAMPGPRPRPPGRVRQQRESLTSFDPASPPPYALEDANESFGDSKFDIDLSTLDETTLEHHTKAELSSLLLQASDTLNIRQNELTLAASIGQQLLQVNMNLQAKYDALLAERNPLRSYDTNDTGVPSPSISLNSDRRIHEAISLLQSQNEVLMTQIHHLEEESSEAQRQGKQRIRLLEKEMSLLRSGLELSQQRSHELENQLEEDRGREVKRIVHRNRLKALRERLARPDNPFRSSQDFATLDATSDLSSVTQSPPSSPNVCSVSITHETQSIPDSEHQQTGSPLKSKLSRLNPAAESSGLSNQLLQKIADLEAANKELMASQMEIKTQLESLSDRTRASQYSLELDSAESRTSTLAHSSSSADLRLHGVSASVNHIRRRRVESESDVGRSTRTIASNGPAVSKLPLEELSSSENSFLIDELNRADGAINVTMDSSQLLSTSPSDRNPIIPGAFNSPTKGSPLLLSQDAESRQYLQPLLQQQTGMSEMNSDRSIDRDTDTVFARRSYRSLFLEIWIFLQFFVVVLVFMFSLGRRSPLQSAK